jgi:hypothetical protein
MLDCLLGLSGTPKEAMCLAPERGKDEYSLGAYEDRKIRFRNGNAV